MCAYRPRSSNEAAIAGLASRQGGRVARWQLLEAGVSSGMIQRRLGRGSLHAEWPGVYRVGHTAETRHGRWWGAVLLGGPGACLDGRSAAEARGLLPARSSLISVSTPRRLDDRGHLRFRRRRLGPEPVEGLPVATVAQVLVDLATTAGRRTLERALDEAHRQRTLDVGAVEALTGRGVPGTAALRDALARHAIGTTTTASTHEEAFIAFLDVHGLPRPECNVPITLPDGSEVRVDALWRARRVVVEVDGAEVHGTPWAVEADRRRDLAMTAARYTVIRVTRTMLTAGLAGHLRRALRVG